MTRTFREALDHREPSRPDCVIRPPTLDNTAVERARAAPSWRPACSCRTSCSGWSPGGLGSCPQFSVAGRADVLYRKLDIETRRIIVCTLAVGYPESTS
ncbi:hypothetical protein [Streptomyces capitiformicae]|uniref:hypothetical protein n=1 Tax=Streptomyces capitiformicae TaxID=2014920 RepID=UPI00167BEC2E|nr:hypothetical protein [Streptomyces capitiformicae]